MADALPTHPKGDTGSDMSSSYEAIALFSYACMIAVGFRLVGLKEGQKRSMQSPTYLLYPVNISSSIRTRTSRAQATRRLEYLIWITFFRIRTLPFINGVCY
jgi:hypothetical protein